MDDRYQRGMAVLARLDREQGARLLAALEGVAPDFGRLLVEFAFGDICARPGLDLKTREIATIAALTALGTVVFLQSHSLGSAESREVDPGAGLPTLLHRQITSRVAFGKLAQRAFRGTHAARKHALFSLRARAQ